MKFKTIFLALSFLGLPIMVGANPVYNAAVAACEDLYIQKNYTAAIKTCFQSEETIGTSVPMSQKKLDPSQWSQNTWDAFLDIVVVGIYYYVSAIKSGNVQRAVKGQASLNALYDPTDPGSGILAKLASKTKDRTLLERIQAARILIVFLNPKPYVAPK